MAEVWRVLGAATIEVSNVLGEARLGRAEAVVLLPGAAVTEATTLDTAALEAAAMAEIAGVVLSEAGSDTTGDDEPELPQLPTGPPGAVYLVASKPL